MLQNLGTKAFCFFLFLIQKMENNNDEIISKKLRIMTTVRKFSEQIVLSSDKNTEKELFFFKKSY